MSAFLEVEKDKPYIMKGILVADIPTRNVEVISVAKINLISIL